MSIVGSMIGGTYRWDVDQIQGLMIKLDNQKTQLANDAQNIASLRSDVEGAWQSVAGTNYKGSLDVNEQDIKNIITRVDNIVTKLSKVKNIYATAENEINGEVRSMSSRIIR